MRKQTRTPNNPYLEMAMEGAAHYRRQRHLPALLALWPAELRDFSLKGTSDIVDHLEKALQAERRRGRARHWCYDLNHHLALVGAIKAERSRLDTLRRQQISVKSNTTITA